MMHSWRDAKGNPINCTEKLAVLEGNMRELAETYRDMLDDAVLMGCGVVQAQEAMRDRLSRVTPTVREKSA